MDALLQQIKDLQEQVRKERKEIKKEQIRERNKAYYEKKKEEIKAKNSAYVLTRYHNDEGFRDKLKQNNRVRYDQFRKKTVE